MLKLKTILIVIIMFIFFGNIVVLFTKIKMGIFAILFIITVVLALYMDYNKSKSKILSLIKKYL